MALINFRKESSERSDSSNWTKDLLLETGFYFESIEGCNQNTDNIVTHLFERMRVDYDSSVKGTMEDVIKEVINLEGNSVLERKIKFCKCFGINLSYVLYCDETQEVFLFEFESAQSAKFIRKFNTYQDFSNWIKMIKGWSSNKPFRENQDLPFFDRVLRKSGTAWPTNIDCFICDSESNPIGILEFQNANNMLVENHCNNDYFLCKFIDSNDIRRWQSQEILRLQSGLRLIIITWSKKENSYKLKEVDKIVFPSFFNNKKQIDWNLRKIYIEILNRYVSNKNPQNESIIADNYKSFNMSFNKETHVMTEIINNPILKLEDKTFPSIYYLLKSFVEENKEKLIIDFKNLMNKNVIKD